MKRKLIYSTLLFLFSLSLKAQTAFDGPYVGYENYHVIVSTIEKNDDLLVPKSVVFGSKQSAILHVAPDGYPEWAFDVKLRDTLINDPVTYPATSKMLFISDIEGEFANFRKLLLAAKVIDDQYKWIYGTGSLVIPGDLFDRGKDIVPELWLLYKLEDEARTAGGRTIVILGNHDVMNLSGDHRYTDGKYFKDAWLMHTEINGLFGRDTELGRWLRSKNVIDKIGDVLVMHGGLSPAILDRHLSMDTLNADCRPFYDASPRNIPDSSQLFFGKDALFWYRGYFMQPKATMGLVDSTLKQYKVKYIVVGHTIVTRNIASYYGGNVIGIDIDEHAGHIAAAFYESGKWYILDANGHKSNLKYKPKNDQIKEEDIL